MNRVTLDMTPIDAIMELADGNPGAITVLAQGFNTCPRIDPDSALGGFGLILWLDDNEIYSSDIWVLYKDICDQSMLNLFTVMRSVNLGLLPISEVKATMRQTYNTIDIPALLSRVQAQLPDFGKEG